METLLLEHSDDLCDLHWIEESLNRLEYIKNFHDTYKFLDFTLDWTVYRLSAPIPS